MPTFDAINRAARLGLAVAFLLGSFAFLTSQVEAAEDEPRSTGISPRVVGGEVAPSGAWPSAAFLYLYPPGTDGVGLCGGTLVGSSWLITAAHCVLDSEDRVTTRMDIGIGGTNRTSSDFNGELREASRVIPYPDYRPPTIFLPPRGDLALVRLSQVSTKPIRLIASSSDWGAGSSAKVAGWGLTNPSDPNSFPVLLRQATLTITTNSACEADYPRFDPQAALCATGAADTPPRDACSGDSGGPLETEPAAGVRRLVGLVSYGRVDCGAASGLYTRLDTYRDWIGSYVADSLQAPATVSFGARKSTGTKKRSITKTITLRNLSETRLPAAPSTYTLSGRDVSSFTRAGGCPSKLTYGSTCSVKVTFKPRGKGVKSAVLRITSSRGYRLAEVNLSGKGT